jgi:hypothetical protein
MHQSQRDFNIITNQAPFGALRSGRSETTLAITRPKPSLQRTYTSLHTKFQVETTPYRPIILAKSQMNYKNLESRQIYPSISEPKLGYDRLMETKTTWGERQYNQNETLSLINCESAPYNFVTLSKKKPADTYRNLAPKFGIQHRKKSIAEIHDLGRLYHPNYHPEYQKTIKDNDKAFRRTHGMFTRYLDDAKRKGALSKPFQKFKFF